MCDTVVMVNEQGVWFGKNSDREANEAQIVVRLPAVRGDRSRAVKLTHIPIRQVPNRHAVILSKPHWMWGAEMGINEHGVVIGNEAIFSKLRSGKPGMLGMDLVRLGLERGATAIDALEVMTRLIEQVGQGGPAGFHDKRFHYDNSFIIADYREAWVLETVQNHWAARQVRDYAAISNCLTITNDYDLHSKDLESFAYVKNKAVKTDGDLNFAASFDTQLMPRFAKSKERLACSEDWLDDQAGMMSLTALASHLRSHAYDNDENASELGPLDGSNADICMHAAGPIRRSQTTGSMIAQLSKERVTSLFTGSSAPCLSLFRPVDFDSTQNYSVLADPEAAVEDSLWVASEKLHHRALFDADFRHQLRFSRNEAESRILQTLAAEEPNFAEADDIARKWHEGQRWVLKRKPRSLPYTLQALYWRRNGFKPASKRARRIRKRKNTSPRHPVME